MDEPSNEIVLHVEKIGDGMHGRRILGPEGDVWYTKKAQRTNFWSRHHLKLTNAVDDHLLAEYKTKNLVIHRIDRTVKSTYAKLFHSRRHEDFRFEGLDGNEYQMTGHTFNSKLDESRFERRAVFLIDKPDQKACEFLATFWLRSGILFMTKKRGEIILHRAEGLMIEVGGKQRPTQLLDDLMIHFWAYTDILKAKGDEAVSTTSDSASE